MSASVRLTGVMGFVGWIVVCTATGAMGDDAGFKTIFDGRTLAGWDGDPTYWRIEDGVITGQTTADKPLKHNTFLIWRQGEVDDFELKLEYRISGGNSGVQYRSRENPARWGKWVVGGYQGDFDGEMNWDGGLYAERDRGILATRGEKTVVGDDHKKQVIGSVGDRDELAKQIHPDDWNTFHIIARGNHLVHKVNGQVMAEIVDNDKRKRRRSGILALQVHKGDPMKVQFRNIQLKRLPMEDKKKIVLVAGPPTHAYGAHEHNAGCRLLAGWLNKNTPGIHAAVYQNGWPADPTAFDNANAIVLYCDGGENHMVNAHLDQMDRLMRKGVGLVCLHYGVEVPQGKPGNCLLDWIGGYFETWWSVNPHWTAEFKTLPSHPITQGVKPFTLTDEWYYHMRFRKDREHVTPILTAIPPESTRTRPDGPWSGNPYVRTRKGMAEHVAWAYQRPDGSRGFGLTGGHYQWNWAQNDFRKLVLNALVWTAGANVPRDGVPSKTPTLEELEANLDDAPPADHDREAIRQRLQKLNPAPRPLP